MPMGEIQTEIVVLTFTPPSGETETFAFTTGAAANQAAAMLLIDRIDEWHPYTPGEPLVEKFLAGNYAAMVQGWSEHHDRHPDWGRVEFAHVTLDAMPHPLAAMREKAERWLHEDETSS